MAGTTTQSRTNSHRGGAGRAAREAIARHGVRVPLPVLGEMHLPPPQHLVWYAGVAALVALECIEWPIALILASGKALADNHHSAVLQEFGEALEQAG
jgi:hypothetical protein